MTINTENPCSFTVYQSAKAKSPRTRWLRWLFFWEGRATTRIQFDEKAGSQYWVACSLVEPSRWKRRFFTKISIGFSEEEQQHLWVNKSSWLKRFPMTNPKTIKETKTNVIKELMDEEDLIDSSIKGVQIAPIFRKDVKRIAGPLVQEKYFPTISLEDLKDKDLEDAVLSDLTFKLPKEQWHLIPKITCATSQKSFIMMRDFAIEKLSKHPNPSIQELIKGRSIISFPEKEKNDKGIKIVILKNGDVQVQTIANLVAINFVTETEKVKLEYPFVTTATMTFKANGKDAEDILEMTLQEGEKPVSFSISTQ